MITYTSKEFMKEKFPFYINRWVHDNENSPPVHKHDFVELVYVVNGESEHFFKGERYRLKQSDVFMINPGEEHTFYIPPETNLEIINCLFLPNLIDNALLKGLGISDSMDFFYIHPFLDHNERFHNHLNLTVQDSYAVQSLLEGMIVECNSFRPDSQTLIRLKMIELLILLSRIFKETLSNRNLKSYQCNEQKVLIKRICGYLERHYDTKISASELCDSFAISTRHLNRLFKQETGLTVLEMVHKIRIERAKYLLENTDEKIINIAFKVGYDDPAFFSRLFSRNIGCSPGKYRQKMMSY
ncbi:AraC family transcriptional regulator [Pullulanibacillus sp. KACC 23026]|uniref:AraC family transcriptional regulator n=1 Tax=Pullulanibacillus sp. KACC 23026 TaxID=3028315 RepID=UPI0023AF34D7|nr:AraC family transcriptional regulator [Pullulanibacillus sp. KACC 23026]WEG11063.1 AraC family transcriptional regulator [Pullulanibacillus sp. KACC 23026]